MAQNNDGCVNFLVFLCIAPFLLFALGKGCVSCADEIYKSSNKVNSSAQTPPKNKCNHKWGENGVDPVLRTSIGGIYKDPNYPNHYFDVTTTCPYCQGKGKIRNIKCEDCYGTGFEKRPIPPDGKIPKKPYPNR